MPEKKPGGAGDIARIVKKLTLLDGFRVGIVNLDNILKEVADLRLVDAKAIKAELFKKAEINNYIPSSAKDEYATALFKEYQRKFEPDKFKEEKTEIHQHTKG